MVQQKTLEIRLADANPVTRMLKLTAVGLGLVVGGCTTYPDIINSGDLNGDNVTDFMAEHKVFTRKIEYVSVHLSSTNEKGKIKYTMFKRSNDTSSEEFHFPIDPGLGLRIDHSRYVLEGIEVKDGEILGPGKFVTYTLENPSILHRGHTVFVSPDKMTRFFKFYSLYERTAQDRYKTESGGEVFANKDQGMYAIKEPDADWAFFKRDQTRGQTMTPVLIGEKAHYTFDLEKKQYIRHEQKKQ